MAPNGSGRTPKPPPPGGHPPPEGGPRTNPFDRATVVPTKAHTRPAVDSEAPTGEHTMPPSVVHPTTARPVSLHDLDSVPPLSLEALSQREPATPLNDMRDRLALGDFSGALIIAEGLLSADASNSEAARCAEVCRERLYEMYTARLGSLEAVPHLLVPPEQVRWLSLDHRAGFILSCVDGYSTLEEILDVAGMPVLDALRILFDLHSQRVIAMGAR